VFKLIYIIEVVCTCIKQMYYYVSVCCVGICEAFYDSAPSGPYGTIPYMCKAALQVIPLATKQDSDTIECLIQ